ncbi:hypothetical protein [Marinobacter shengliensis]|uniref:hypothetical protein n=1 Tax=Marinobacter shengliensis TaxID=1389223 RepID=UPI000D0F5301|nr:hypothetical protein [Marinobacter shengliensis]PSF13734.1 hypothetical protein C7H10_06635 [Marinobacter shengliensis]
MKRTIAIGFVLVSMLSGCAATGQTPIQFRTSNDLTFELSNSQFDTVDVQPFETQIWLDSAMIGSLMTMETNPDFDTAVDEVRQGFDEAEKSSGKIVQLDLGDSAYGFSVTVNGYTTAFIATSKHPTSWITISIKEDVFDDVLSSMSVSKAHK